MAIVTATRSGGDLRILTDHIDGSLALPKDCCCLSGGVASCADPCSYRIVIDDLDLEDSLCGDIASEYQGSGYSRSGCTYVSTPSLNTGPIDDPISGYQGIHSTESYPASAFRQYWMNSGVPTSGGFASIPFAQFQQGITGYSVNPDEDPENPVYKYFLRTVGVSLSCVSDSEAEACPTCFDDSPYGFVYKPHRWRLSVFEALDAYVNEISRTIYREVVHAVIKSQDCGSLTSFEARPSLRHCQDPDVSYEECHEYKDFHIGDYIVVQATPSGVVVTIDGTTLATIPWDTATDTGSLTLPEPYDATPAVAFYTAPCCCYDAVTETETYCNPLP